MKTKLLTTFIVLFMSTFGFSQISISTGLALPVGSFNNLDDGAANLGYQFTANWDKSLGDTYGLSMGLLYTGNALNEESEIFTDGRWRYTALS